MEILGIDIGGSSLKGAIVNAETGELLTETLRITTPSSRKPQEIADAVKQMAEKFNFKGAVGCGFPTIVKKGICKDPGNLSRDWLGVDVDLLFEQTTGLNFTVINDADAAGLAEVQFGAGRNEEGFILMITAGTGLGSGAYLHGELIPNFELGQIPYKEFQKIEEWAAASVKDIDNLSYKDWGYRFNIFLNYIFKILNPDVIIVGGGISNDWDKFVDFLKVDTKVIPAQLRNNSGIMGAAIAAKNKYSG
ncbi:polyphosphate--glucose phosphotransferase [Christiangramia salexigens]|uniref:Polyphosphate glucokinase n=1 Tax=Christiangramia salexigens TaxID=1913577 RepID=A0A1L3J195_9FLAO|nr:ROK family protein [Christiangramia salexigens]APG58895.1 polyphosphate glucokinase [Christiangramia salexigens]APG61325.1 polyphosphate glucokinase [Christiangramia salexigens]